MGRPDREAGTAPSSFQGQVGERQVASPARNEKPVRLRSWPPVGLLVGRRLRKQPPPRKDTEGLLHVHYKDNASTGSW